MFTKNANQSSGVSTTAFEKLLRQYPFKDLTGFPGYIAIPYEATLAQKYHAYVAAMQRFVEEKETNELAFSAMNSTDQKKESWHPGDGDKEDGRKRLSYAASRLTLDLMYLELKKVALDLRQTLSNPKRNAQMAGWSALSEERQQLLLSNITFATGALGFFLDIQNWRARVKGRPSHKETLTGSALVLSGDVFSLLTEHGAQEMEMREHL